MKKWIACCLAFVMAAGMLAGCQSAPKREPVTGTTEEIIERIYAEEPLEIAVMTVAVDTADTAWSLPSYTGLTSAENVMEASASEAMINAVAYSMVLVRVKDAADAKAVAEQMRAGIDQRKWICVEADAIRVVGYDDLVLLVMADSQLDVSVDKMVAAFQTVCGGSLDFTL